MMEESSTGRIDVPATHHQHRYHHANNRRAPLVLVVAQQFRWTTAVLLTLLVIGFFLTLVVDGLSFVTAPKRASSLGAGCGMTKRQAFWQSQHTTTTSRQKSSSSSPSSLRRTELLVMRDASASYWFNVGDTVRVVQDVYKENHQDQAAGVNNTRVNLLGRVGTVLQTWEKDAVDPCCCCAEQVDPGMAVRVRFDSSHEDGGGDGDDDAFEYYFAEEELVQVKQEEEETKSAPNLPFDGMSCTAFKLDELQKAGQKPRGIASFDPQHGE